jgi:diamine N-acetyltransferase
MQIIPAAEYHIPLIQQVANITWPHTFGNLMSEKQFAYMMDWMYSTESLRKQMNEQGHRFLLAMQGNACVGYASYQLNYEKPGTTKIHKLYILPQSQGGGVGRKLLNAVADLVIQGGNNSMILAVKRDNKAVDFYKKLGFVVIDSVDIEIGDGFFMRDYIMEIKPGQLKATASPSHGKTG